MQKFLAIALLVIVGVVMLRFFSDDRSPPLKKKSASPGLAELLSDQGIEGYAKAEEVRQFSFPDDHGPHPEYRHE
ncbi:MAG: hypothetical protein ACU0DI_05990, partial [Paracoccaceae bacterium]